MNIVTGHYDPLRLSSQVTVIHLDNPLVTMIYMYMENPQWSL